MQSTGLHTRREVTRVGEAEAAVQAVESEQAGVAEAVSHPESVTALLVFEPGEWRLRREFTIRMNMSDTPNPRCDRRLARGHRL